ncbi:beta-lactamase family protein [Marivirga sp. S37H4]|uniref:Beta-lactamase family protein n=1 Tax=Marivirga aurantiaca TaxID=2802615 RepID=A0A934X0D9_9BACT|nr:serine hydrolase domain-containing protein [Marivirga aurantiaca]MBK6266192.1 beta-lactamase family protein [Marivirga aurantiaca]
MKKKLIILLALIIPGYLNGQQNNSLDFSKIEHFIKEAIEKEETPSVAIAVAKDGMIIYQNAFGYADIENKIEANSSTAYQLASITKPITATAVMILNHQKIIDIYSQAEKYMDPLQFKATETNPSDVKIINLLNHTSGLGTYFQLNYADEPFEGDDFKTAFNKYGKLFYPVGRICEYSNLGYGLLDYIISNQSGKSYAQFLQTEIFNPLGMNNSFVNNPDNPGLSVAKKYDKNLKLLPEIINNTTGAGNVYSSIQDLIKFGMFHLISQENDILSPKEVDLMHNYIDPDVIYPYYDSTYYGLGWYFKNDDGYRIVWHEGGMMGASTMLKLIPDENIAIAVMLNTSNQAFSRAITDQLSSIVLPGYNPKPTNEIANYKQHTADTSLYGTWKGTMSVEGLDIPCTLHINSDGTIMMEYLDYTYKSYFTNDNPIPNKSILLNGMINKNSFIGMYPGNLPSEDIRQEMSQFMSLKLFKDNNNMTGTIVALAAADREYYAYPFYIKLEKQ